MKDEFNPENFGFGNPTTEPTCMSYTFGDYEMLRYNEKNIIYENGDVIYSGKIPTNTFAKELFKNIGIL